MFAQLGGTPDGYDPQGALVDGGDGFFYGTTEAGGPANLGTVYKIGADGTFATLYAFTGGTDGANPQAALLNGGDGFFYGTTSSGGNGSGTVFKITPAGVVTTLYDFAALDASLRNADGTSPQAALVSGGDGFFYGTTTSGGASGLGTIFRVTASGAFNVVYSLSRSTDGSVPKAALTPGGDGFLYGTTYAGGTGHGTVFRVTSAGVYQVLYNFTGGPDGAAPQSALVLSGGVFYGLTQSTFFSVTPAGVLTPLYTFDTPEGKGIFGGLIAGPGGNFYGTALKDAPDGTGNLFQLTPTGGFTLLHKFDTAADGAGPVPAPVLDAAGNLYGVAETGGGGNDTGGGGGTVYRYNATGTFETLHPFFAGGSYASSALLEGADGNFYGVTQQGGANGAGTAFILGADGNLLDTYDCNPDTDGRGPDSALVDGGNGSFYGTTAGDGPDGIGTVYQLTVTFPTSQTSARTARARSGGHPRYQNPGVGDAAFGWITLHLPPDQDNGKFDEPYGVTTFIPNNHPSSRSTTTAAASPTLYGVFQAGGAGDGGGVFTIPSGGSPTYLHEFGTVDGDGILPSALVEGEDGNFYGTTYGGGTASKGTIFKLGADGTYSVLYSFQGTGDGAYLQAGLTAGSDGNLYGVTPTGYGTIFSITPGGTFTTLHTFATDDSEGQQPITELLQANDGNLYGTTGDGVLFSISHGGQFTRLYRRGYDAATGVYNNSTGISLSGAVAPLIQAADGNLYGTTTSGGTDGAGVVFEVDLNATSTPTPTPTPVPTPTPTPTPSATPTPTPTATPTPTPTVTPTPTPSIPVVTVTTADDGDAFEGGEAGKVKVIRTGDTAESLVVRYKAAGSAVAGLDYKALAGTVVIPAGALQAKIKIKAINDASHEGIRIAKIKLKPATDGSYTVGTPGTAKIKIIDND